MEPFVEAFKPSTIMLGFNEMEEVGGSMEALCIVHQDTKREGEEMARLELKEITSYHSTRNISLRH